MATAIGRARSARAALISILALTAMALSAGGVSAAPPNQFTVDQASVDFGSVVIGSSSATQTLTVTAGRKDVVLEVGTDNGQYSLDSTGTCLGQGYQLAAGSSCTIDMTFTPLSAGSYPATLTLVACMKWEPNGVTGLPHCTRVKDEQTVSLGAIALNTP